jgi:uncharacterized protein involved in exopolysaccharide biosynthesis
VLDEHGEVISESRKRLSDAKYLLASARRNLAEINAEIAALTTKLSVRTEAGAAPDGAHAESPAIKAIRSRIEAADAEIALLREGLTDEHPRLVKLHSARADLAAQLATMMPQGAADVDDTIRLQVRRHILEKESEMARTASRVKAYEEEEKRLTEFVKNEATAAEEKARRFHTLMKDAEAASKAVRERIAAAELAASQNTAAQAALTVRNNPPPTEAIRTGATPGVFAFIGACIGLVFAAMLVAFAEALNPVLRSSEDVRRNLDLPVLATIPGSAFKLAAGRNPRTMGSILWLVTFLVIATMLLTLVYPGWNRLRTLLARHEKQPAAEVSE